MQADYSSDSDTILIKRKSRPKSPSKPRLGEVVSPVPRPASPPLIFQEYKSQGGTRAAAISSVDLMESLQLLLLSSDKDDKQGQIFQSYFHSFPNVSVVREDQTNTADCLAIPCPSSFAQPMGDLTSLNLLSKLSDKTREAISRSILDNFYGEQNPSSAFIIKNKAKDAKFKYIAFLCLARLPDSSTPDFAYTSMRGLLLEVMRFNSQHATAEERLPIETLMIPSFAYSHYGTSLEEKKRLTKLMALAYRNMFYPIRHMPSTEEARILSSQISEKVLESPADKRNRTKELLKSGDLEARGLYDEEELNFLIESIQTDNELREAAGKTLCSLLHNQPSEFCLSHETLCGAIAKSKDGLQYLLDQAEMGKLQIFRVIQPSEIKYGDEIGNGTEAQVLKATWQGLDVAVKKFKGIPNSKEFQRELSIMSLVHHPNLVRCYGGYSDTVKDVYFLVMDLMEIDVNNVLHNPPDNSWKLNYERQIKIALHTARGLEYLHSCNLIHRDLKSVNLLIDRDFNAKLCDFGLSRVVAAKKNNVMTGNVGTVSWIAPEVFEKQPYDAKADVYSFGIVLWELHTHQTPFADINTFEIPMVVIKGDRPPIPKDMPKDYVKLMKVCWNKKPSKRPDFGKIVKEISRFYKAIGPEQASPLKEYTLSSSSPNLLSKFMPAIKRSDSLPPGANTRGAKSTPQLGMSSQSLPEGSISEGDSSSTAESDDQDADTNGKDKEKDKDSEKEKRDKSPAKGSRAAALLAMGPEASGPAPAGGRRRAQSTLVLTSPSLKRRGSGKRPDKSDKPEDKVLSQETTKSKRRTSTNTVDKDALSLSSGSPPPEGPRET